MFLLHHVTLMCYSTSRHHLIGLKKKTSSLRVTTRVPETMKEFLHFTNFSFLSEMIGALEVKLNVQSNLASFLFSWTELKM